VLKLLRAGELTLPQARAVFEQVYRTNKAVDVVVEEQGFEQQNGGVDLEKICSAVISDNPQVVADVKSGKTNAVQVLVGAVMKQTRGGADPKEARKLLLKLLRVG